MQPCQSFITIIILLIVSSYTFLGSRGATCGSAKPCLDGSCCSQYGFCGNTSAFCGDGCLSLCKHLNSSIKSASSGMNIGSEAEVSSAITDDIFDQSFFAHLNSTCPAHGFYNRSFFLTAAAMFPAFGTSGGFNSSREELAAFFAFASQFTAGGCYVEAMNHSVVDCTQTSQWGCASGMKYYGRGPLQIAWNMGSMAVPCPQPHLARNTNYGPMGDALGFDGISDPDMLEKDPVLSFKAALWFWMNPHSPKMPSCHEAILSQGQGFNEVVVILSQGGHLDPAALQKIQDTFSSLTDLILGIKPNGTTSPSTKSCIGSLCSTSSKVKGMLIPLAMGGIVLFVLAFLALNILRRRWRSRGDEESGQGKTMKLEKIQGLAGTPINFSYATLASATQGFSAVLGRGGFGIVYKGVLPTGEAIAVKVLNLSTQTEQQFLTEIESLGKLHHVNVVRLMGFCIDKAQKLLVYEFISNSSLEKHLFVNGDQDTGSLLSWETRYEIALGIAKGLSYIHEECAHKIIHRDLKPQNVLLDDFFCPKISDFGLAKIIKREESSVMSGLKGTPGYMPPEYWRSRRGKLSTKFDIYSFGMVALELVTGHQNFQEDMCSEQAHFLEFAFGTVCSPGGIIDYRIANQANLSQAKILVLVALWCIQEDPAQRPSMSRVVQYLEGSVDMPVNRPQILKGASKILSSSTVATAPSKLSSIEGR